MTKVAIVVDRAFGDRLPALARSRHVWVVGSSANTAVIRGIWQDTPAEARCSMRNGATSFVDNADLSAEEICAGIAGVVDEHHGELSSDPPWSEIEVFGVGLTPTLRSAFEGIGASAVDSTTDGFVCHRARAA
jgi:hypothetical protein